LFDVIKKLLLMSVVVNNIFAVILKGHTHFLKIVII